MIPPIRKTNADDEDAEIQATTGVSAGFKIRCQPMGAELDKDAQVWEIYVDETDRSDRELVKGWNDSLDVLLIFAALFSAITTALVIESSKQLQPDPAETSAQTLQFMSQTLIAISNGQAVDASTLPGPSTSSFSPSRTSVLVNVLWFLSLTLSVAVSLVAMLSKSWCNVFMSGRSGPKYEQGRRRQRKWDGIERWGMVGVFVYLPTLMHLALLLFAIGLSVYLWDVSIPVAIPVFLVTVIFVSIYAIVTVLPLVHTDCPYSSPLSKPLATVVPITREVSLLYWNFLLRSLQTALTATLEFLTKHLQSQYLTKWHERALQRRDRADTSRDHVDVPQHQAVSDAGATPMDDVTCHMLLWMIMNCEDSRLIDVALQSIAGARHGFPWSILSEADVTEILAQRLEGCIVRGMRSSASYLKPTASAESALMYTQGFCQLLELSTGFKHGSSSQPSSEAPSAADGVVSAALEQRLDNLCNSFLCDVLFTASDDLDRNLAAISLSSAATLACSLSSQQHFRSHFYSDITACSNKLMQHHPGRTATMNSRALLVLLLAAPRWMIEGLASMSDEERNRSVVQLVQLVHSPSCSAPDLQYAIGLALTTAAFLTHQYPGGEHPVNSNADSTARAIKVYHYYKVQHYEEPKTLIAFGLLGLLDKSDTHTFSDNEATAFASTLTRLGDIHFLPQHIHTLPQTLSLTQYAKQIVLRYLQAIPEEGSTGSENVLVSCLTALTPQANWLNNPSDIQVALEVFCGSHSSKVQRVCLKALNWIDNSVIEQVDLERVDPTLFSKLVDISMGNDVLIAPTAMRYLWALIGRLLEEVRSSSKEQLTDILSQILKHDAFVSLRARASGLPSPPQNICEAGFTEMWYPMLWEMRSHKATARAVARSGVLYHMYQSYDEQGMRDVAPYLEELRDERSWYRMLKELEDMPIPDEASL